MLLQLLVVGAPERKAQVSQRLKLVCLYDGKGSVRATHACVEHSQELGLGAHHRRARAHILRHVLLAERKKFYQVAREGLKVDVELLFGLERVEVLLGATQLEQEERVFVVGEVNDEGLLLGRV